MLELCSISVKKLMMDVSIEHPKREKIIQMWIEFSQIPDECREFFREHVKHYDYFSLAKPFIINDLKNRVSPGMLLVKYGITEGQLRQAAIVAGIWKPKRSKKLIY